MPDELPRLLARGRKAHAVHQIVQPALEGHEQRFARYAWLLDRPLEQVAELALGEAVDPLHLLLFAQLLRVLRRLAAPSGRLAMLPRRVRATLDGAFLRQAARALEKQFGAFAPAQSADGSRVTRHARPRSEEHTSELQSLTNLVC